MEFNLGDVWVHIKTGSIYTVVLITNEMATKEDYPITVVYKGEDGSVWSRPLSSWNESFIKL